MLTAPHGAHVTGGAGDDAEQHQALHGQVVEAVAAAQVQRGVELGAGPGPVVAFEQRRAPAQAGERLQLPVRPAARRRSAITTRPVGGRSPRWSAPSCSATARSTVTIRRPAAVACRAASLPRVAQVGPRRGQVAGLEMGQRGGQGQPRIGRGGWRAEAGQRAAQRPVVARSRISGMAKRCSSSDSSAGLRLRGGVVEGADRLDPGRPTSGRPWRAARPPVRALALQVGEQVGAQELLDPVGVAPLVRWRTPARSGARAGRARCRRPPGRTAAAASPDGTGSLMLITRRNSWMSSGSPERISPTR